MLPYITAPWIMDPMGFMATEMVSSPMKSTAQEIGIWWDEQAQQSSWRSWIDVHDSRWIQLPYPAEQTHIAMENQPFIDDLPINNGGFPERTVSLPEGSQLDIEMERIWKNVALGFGILTS